MATYYLDYVNGLDAQDGSNWANAKKTLGGFTLSAGDIVRVAKSPDKVLHGNADFVKGSEFITLADGTKTKTIERCEANWTQSTNVTSSLEASTLKEGAGALKLVFAAGFTTGKAAYKDISTLDVSGYEAISFWIYSTSGIIAANTVRVDLCSDNLGATPVDSFTIPFAIKQSQWTPIYINKGSALGSAIESIAITMLIDPSTLTVYFDNFIAVKTDGLQLGSLVGRGGINDQWYRIGSIVDTEIRLMGIGGNKPNSSLTISKDIYGAASGTFPLYYLNPIKTYLTSGTIHTLGQSGEAGNLITISGGWNTSTNLQDGETWYEGVGSAADMFYATGKSYFKVERMGGSRFAMAFDLTGVCHHYELDFCYSEAASSRGFYVNGSYESTFDHIHCYGSSNQGIDITNYACNNTFTNVYTNNNGSGIKIYYGANYNKISDHWSEFDTYSLYLYDCYGNTIIRPHYHNPWYSGGDYGTIYNDVACQNYVLEGQAYSSPDAYVYSGQLFLIGTTSYNTAYPAKVGYGDYGVRNYLEWKKISGDANDHRFWADAFKALSETSIRHTASGVSWKIMPLETTYPTKLRFLPYHFKIPVKADSLLTVKIWVRKDSTYDGIAPKLILMGGVVAGINADVIDTFTEAADTWEELQVTGTPTEDGVAEFYIEFSGTAGAIYVDDVTVTQP